MTRQTMTDQHVAPGRIAARGRITYIERGPAPDHTRKEAPHALVIEFDNDSDLHRFCQQLHQTEHSKD